MKKAFLCLVATLLCLAPAAAQLDSVGQTPTAVTLVTDTLSTAADSAFYAPQSTVHHRQFGFYLDEPLLESLLGLTGLGLLGFLVLPLVVIVVGVVLIVRALRRPLAPPVTTPSAVALWIHRRQNAAVRLAALGVGMALLFGIVGSGLFSGVGLLIACIGGGNYWTARRDRRFYETNHANNDHNPCDNTSNSSGTSSTTEP